MENVSEIQGYMEKWLEAERDLMVLSYQLQAYALCFEPTDFFDKEQNGNLAPGDIIPGQ